MGDRKLVYTVAEASELLGITKVRVYELIHSGILKGFKCGRMSVSLFAIQDFLKKYEGLDISNPKNITQLS